MATVVRWCLGLAVAAVVVGVPVYHFRDVYETNRRFRVVTPGRFYRSGQLTAEGFEKAVREHGIRTVVNVQNEFPDPAIQETFPFKAAVPQSDLCRRLGVRYVWLDPDLIDRGRVPAERPRVIDEWLRLLDDPASYPILLHCKAGLHRTGVLTAVYRMEYCGWSAAAATREIRANGFGDAACTTANDYLVQYVQTYRPRVSR